MEFRLIYEGPLRSDPASAGPAGRAADKHALRKHFHPQLRQLWNDHPELRRQAEGKFVVETTPPNMVSHPGPNVRQIIGLGPKSKYPGAKGWIEHIADDHARLGTRFVPLISKAGGYVCSLNILFLRRDSPGNLVASGGDIDNRMKMLLDGLRMPDTFAELGGHVIAADENPFFCLLEDDKWITDISVTTDRLLKPLTNAGAIHGVHLIIHVTVVNPSAIFAGDRLV